MSVYDVFDFSKIFSVLVDVFSVVAMLLSFFGVMALYKIRDKVKQK